MLGQTPSPGIWMARAGNWGRGSYLQSTRTAERFAAPKAQRFLRRGRNSKPRINPGGVAAKTYPPTPKNPKPKILGCQYRISRTSIYRTEKKPKLPIITTSQPQGGTVVMMFVPWERQQSSQRQDA